MQKANALVKDEIIPVLGDASKAEAWGSAIEKENINVIVDCSAVYQGATDILNACASISKKRLATYGHGSKGPKLGYIYLSGSWVLGDTQAYTEELSPVGAKAPVKPAELVAWRVDIENLLMEHSAVLNGISIRPGTMYGGNGSSIGQVWWAPIREAVSKGQDHAELPGRPEAILSLVHKDDVGGIVVKAVEKVS